MKLLKYIWILASVLLLIYSINWHFKCLEIEKQAASKAVIVEKTCGFGNSKHSILTVKFRQEDHKFKQLPMNDDSQIISCPFDLCINLSIGDEIEVAYNPLKDRYYIPGELIRKSKWFGLLAIIVFLLPFVLFMDIKM